MFEKPPDYDVAIRHKYVLIIIGIEEANVIDWTKLA
tara:strand:- start:414 stop:521 length:108 start_codon:yes stop_codon:yes gene_type:complete